MASRSLQAVSKWVRALGYNYRPQDGHIIKDLSAPRRRDDVVMKCSLVILEARSQP